MHWWPDHTKAREAANHGTSLASSIPFLYILSMNEILVVPAIMDLHLPAGVLGPEPVSYDVRAFVLPHADGVVLIDTGFDPDAGAIADALASVGRHWHDVTDIILTHDHVDHVGALAAIVTRAPSAIVWAGHGDTFTTPVRRVGDGDVIRGLRVVTTPGHTPGHLSLFEETHRILFAGDVVGNMDGHIVLAPQQFTADAQQALLSLHRLAALVFDRLIFSHGAELPDPAAALAELIERSDAAS